jgi:hypothetical protein
MKWFLALAGLLPLAAVGARAAAPESLEDGVRRCTHESDERQRLACFDALAKTLPKMQADQFGLTAQIKHDRDPSVPYAKDDVLTGKIAAMQQAPRGEWIFTLDNAQIWIQAEPSTRIRFEVGEPVRIEHGAMGSLWLAADKGRKTKVKRIS